MFSGWYERRFSRRNFPMIASFSDANPNASAADFSATISWGDGSSSAGTVRANGWGGFDISGDHTFSQSGDYALTTNSAGNDNVAEGHFALFNATGSSNVALGSGAGQNLTTGSNNVDLANPGVAGESGRIRIGTKGKQSAAYLQGVYGKTAAGGVPVLINSAGKLGTASAAKAQPLSAAAGRGLVAQVRRQQREIKRLRELVRGGR